MNPLQKPGRSLYFHAKRHGILIPVSTKKRSIDVGFRRFFLLAARRSHIIELLLTDEELTGTRGVGFPSEQNIQVRENN